jgi:hypothetical protein
MFSSSTSFSSSSSLSTSSRPYSRPEKPVQPTPPFKSSSTRDVFTGPHNSSQNHYVPSEFFASSRTADSLSFTSPSMTLKPTSSLYTPEEQKYLQSVVAEQREKINKHKKRSDMMMMLTANQSSFGSGRDVPSLHEVPSSSAFSLLVHRSL